MKIPKKIFTIWISEKEMPEKMQECCKTHLLKGYEHKMITLDNCFKDSIYLQEVIQATKWIKAADFLRMYYLYNEGGIYVDCDMDILKPFDDLLDNDMFVCREDEKRIANSIIGAKKGHPLLREYLNKVESNFRGGGDMIFEPAERLFTDLVEGTYGEFGDVKIYPRGYFFPEEKIYTFHHFTRSWKKK